MNNDFKAIMRGEKMREPTEKEKEIINNYIKSISETTEIDFFQPKKVVGEMISVSVLEDIRSELHENAEMHEDGDWYLRDKWVDEIIDKHMAKLQIKR